MLVAAAVEYLDDWTIEVRTESTGSRDASDRNIQAAEGREGGKG